MAISLGGVRGGDEGEGVRMRLPGIRGPFAQVWHSCDW